MNRKARQQGRKAGSGPPPQEARQLIELCRARRFSEAIEPARALTKKWPKAAVGWHALAMSAEALGELDEAERAHRKALQIEPDNADGHNNLGLLLARAGRHEEASKSYRRALRLRPRFPEAQFNLGLSLSAAGRLEEAGDCYRRVLEIRPDFAEAQHRLADNLAAMGEAADAEAGYRAALEQQPGHVSALNNLALLLVGQGRMEEAESLYRAALERDPAIADVHGNLGNLLMDTGRLDEAAASHRRAAELRPGDAAAQRQLGNAMAVMGRTEEAEQAFRSALEIAPADAESWYYLSQAKRFGDDDPDLDRLHALRNETELPPRRRMYLLYALGKALADTNASPDGIIECWREAGRCWHEDPDADPEVERAEMEAIGRVFTAERLAAFEGGGDATEAPIFIVGMPRSGTTLVEQILASHPRVHGAGERMDLERHVDALARELGGSFSEAFAQATPELMSRLGSRYRETVVDGFTDVDRVTDKMPPNFRYLGLIAAALPNARIVHVMRDAADTCLSCFERPFVGRYAFSYDLENLGRYFRAYTELMGHWRKVLPANRMLELRYEDLVAEPEEKVRALLDHCGLEWDERCLAFHETQRAVPTASLNQVRQPLYSRSVGRWKRYREHLDPLFEALGPYAP